MGVAGPIFKPQRKMEEAAKKKGRKIGIGTCFFLFILFLITILGKKMDKETILCFFFSCAGWIGLLLPLAGIFNDFGKRKSDSDLFAGGRNIVIEPFGVVQVTEL